MQRRQCKPLKGLHHPAEPWRCGGCYKTTEPHETKTSAHLGAGTNRSNDYILRLSIHEMLGLAMAKHANTQLEGRAAVVMLRSCLLSGGASRRMGRDKALLPHPAGLTWLEHTLQQLAELGAPITLLSRWPEHLQRAHALALPQLEAIAEPSPWQGPLLALNRLMQLHPNQRLLLCPVDMPGLNARVLNQLLQAADGDATAIHLAHDGHRSQPLLGIYPATETRRHRLARAIAMGERGLQRWLADERCRGVQLKAESIQNVNCVDELDQLSHL